MRINCAPHMTEVPEMARRRTCPHCRRGHETTTPCEIAALTDAVREAPDRQSVADAAEATAIRRYLGLTDARDDEAA
jgi:hypothetical protein